MTKYEDLTLALLNPLKKSYCVCHVINVHS